MATTTVANVAGLIPAVIAADAFDVYTNRVVLSKYAVERRDLEGQAGDRVSLGTWAAVSPADELVETTSIVPENLSATTAAFIIKELGKGVEWTRKAGRLSRQDMQTRASNAVGNAIARKIDLSLGADAYNARATAKDVVATGANDPMSAAKIRRGKRNMGEIAFGDDAITDLILVLRSVQYDALVAERIANGQAAPQIGERALREGVIDRIAGVDIVVSDALPTVTGTRGAYTGAINLAFMFRRQRSLVSAYAERPDIEVDYNIWSRTYGVAGTCLWTGGLAEPASFAAIESVGD